MSSRWTASPISIPAGSRSATSRPSPATGISSSFRRTSLELDLEKFLEGVDAVYHLAAQAGVRSSWGENFSVYIQNNIQTTQRLLEAAKDSPSAIRLRLVFLGLWADARLCP